MNEWATGIIIVQFDPCNLAWASIIVNVKRLNRCLRQISILNQVGNQMTIL